ncbi:MAG: HlyD family secretion protein [Nitrospirota bacterium]
MSEEPKSEVPAKKSGNGNKKRRAAIILLVLIVIGGFIGIRVYALSKIHVNTDDAFIDAHVYQVSARVSGYVKRVNVDDNQSVKKGDVLVGLDTSDYITSVNNASASLDLAKNETHGDVANVGSAEAAVNLAKSRLDLAAKNDARGETLFKKGIIARQDLDTLTTDKKVAASALKDVEDARKKAAANAGFLVPGGDKAKIAQKEAQLAQAKLNLGYTSIVSPADGYVTNKSVEPGNNVQPGQALLAVVELNNTWVTANYKENQLTYVRPGQQVEFAVDTYPNMKFRGKVDSIMAGTGAAFSLLPPENATGNYVKIVQRIPVKILIDQTSDPKHLLRVGMSVEPTISTGKSIMQVLRDAVGI